MLQKKENGYNFMCASLCEFVFSFVWT